MDWVKIIIPAIAIAIYVLAHLASGRKEQRQPGVRPPLPPREPPRDPDQPAPRRPASAELDSFLEEMRQRKRFEEQTPVEPIVVEEAPRPPAPRRDERRRSKAVGSKPPQRRPEPVIVVPSAVSAPPPLPNFAPVVIRREVAPAQFGPPPLPAAPHSAVAPPALSAVARPAPARSDNPQVQIAPRTPANLAIAELLKSRQSLAAAFLLREILDRPLCQRPRRTARDMRPARPEGTGAG